MSKPAFSLTKRLLVLILGISLLLWVLSFSLVWFGARHELEEIIQSVPSDATNAALVQEEHDELLGHLLWGLLTPFLVGIPMLALLIIGVIIYSLRSTRRLSQALLQGSGNDLQPIPSKDLPKEILPLVDSINTQLRRVEKNIEKEKRFTANAAHELRTPLASMRAQAQLAALTPDPDLRAKTLNQLQQTADNAAHVLEQLSALARLDMNITDAQGWAQLHFPPWLRKQVSLAIDQNHGQHQWELLVHSQEASIKTEPGLLAIAVRNILNNAMNYSPAGGLIQVLLHSSNTHVTLTINDSGMGMEETDLARLGERFFRAQQHQQTVGSGLGWSIVYAIAEQLKLSVALQGKGPLGGMSVSLQLPLHAANPTSGSNQNP